ncbi:hypothetical protein CR513_21151, partial [Mucuna pruriens]
MTKSSRNWSRDEVGIGLDLESELVSTWSRNWSQHGVEIGLDIARLVAKGYRQQHGVDYNEVFAPVAHMKTIRLLISIATQMGWRIFQLDVKLAFLNDYLDENVYVEQPMGFAKRRKQWVRSLSIEYALYVKKIVNDDILLLCLYVDDLIFTGNNPNLFEDFKKVMSCEVEMTDIGLIYATKVMEKFKKFDCNLVNTPMEGNLKLSRFDRGEKEDLTLFKSLVGSLKYLTSTRLDIMYTVGVVCRLMEAPTSTHMKTTKRILRYLKAEYVAATSCTCQTIWLRRLLKEFNMNQEESTKIHIDNKFVQILAKNMVFHERSKHIDTMYHFIRECIVKKEVELVPCEDSRSSYRYFY